MAKRTSVAVSTCVKTGSKKVKKGLQTRRPTFIGNLDVSLKNYIVVCLDIARDFRITWLPARYYTAFTQRTFAAST